MILIFVFLLGMGVFCVFLWGSMFERGYVMDFNLEYFVNLLF